MINCGPRHQSRDQYFCKTLTKRTQQWYFSVVIVFTFWSFLCTGLIRITLNRSNKCLAITCLLLFKISYMTIHQNQESLYCLGSSTHLITIYQHSIRVDCYCQTYAIRIMILRFKYLLTNVYYLLNCQNMYTIYHQKFLRYTRGYSTSSNRIPQSVIAMCIITNIGIKFVFKVYLLWPASGFEIAFSD